MKVLLLDVMGTLVHDPFGEEFPAFFGRPLSELLDELEVGAWVEFELGAIDESCFLSRLFRDRREYDARGLVEHIAAAYRFLDGVEPLLAELARGGHAMHTLSNYPSWYRRIEARLELSRYVAWTNVSCEMGVRKPDLGAFRVAAARVGVPPSGCLFVDDREENCLAAERAGMEALRFVDAGALRAELLARGYSLGGATAPSD